MTSARASSGTDDAVVTPTSDAISASVLGLGLGHSPLVDIRTVDPALVADPTRLLAEVPLGALLDVTGPRPALEAVGFTVHYWHPSPSGTNEAYIEVIAEHPGSGVWVASRLGDRLINGLADAVRLVADVLDTSIYPAAASLPGLAHALAGMACSPQRAGVDRVGEHWVEGGLLLGCLRLLDTSALSSDNHAQGRAVRTVLSLMDTDIVTQVDQLACWQEAMSDNDLRSLRAAAEDAYYEATLALWPGLDASAAPDQADGQDEADVPGFVSTTESADSVARAISAAHLMSHPREDWPRAAQQIVLDMLARHEKWVYRHMITAYHKQGLPVFVTAALLAAAARSPRLHPAVRVPVAQFD